jgi:hypothetical protein
VLIAKLLNKFLFLFLKWPWHLGYYEVQLPPSWTKPFQFLIHELPRRCGNFLRIQELVSVTELIKVIFHPLVSSVPSSHPRTPEIDGPRTLGFLLMRTLVPSWTKPFQFLILELPPMCEVRYKTRVGLSDRFNKRRFSSTSIIRLLFSSTNTKS